MNPMWHDLQPTTQQQPEARWLMTFADLISLLVVFFVLLFSMKEIDRDRWEQLTGSFQGVFAPRDAVVWQRPDSFNNAAAPKPKRQDHLKYLDSLVQRRVGQHPLWQGILNPMMDTNELRYALPKAWVVGGDNDQLLGVQAIEALALEIRNWDNPVVLRWQSDGVENIPQAEQRLLDMRAAMIRRGAGQVLKQVEWRMVGTGEDGLWLVVGKDDWQ